MRNKLQESNNISNLLVRTQALYTQLVHPDESSPYHNRHSPSVGLGKSALCPSVAAPHHQCKVELSGI